MARILIADDSEITRKLLAATLGTHEGWTVCGEAVNGRNAILMAHDLKPDLVIMDLVMPMLDGLQASAEIAKNAPSVPIVIYSLQILPELEMEAKKYGVWAMVSKSADRNILIETVERLLGSTQLPDNSKTSTTDHQVCDQATPEISSDPD
jgi:DNA-binding NarL/FixJ family response regulator